MVKQITYEDVDYVDYILNVSRYGIETMHCTLEKYYVGDDYHIIGSHTHMLDIYQAIELINKHGMVQLPWLFSQW